MSAIWTCVICGAALYYYDMAPCVQPEFGQLVKTKSRIWMRDKELKSGELAIAIKTTNFANWSQDTLFKTMIISRYGLGWVASEELIIIA